jgi:hypothetical protein
VEVPPAEIPTVAPPDVLPDVPPAVEEVTPVVPGVPITGGKLVEVKPAPVVAAPQPAEPVAAPVESFAPMLFRIFYDRDQNDRFTQGEGIRGISVYLLDADANTPTGTLVTSGTGDGRATLPVRPQRVFVPYLGINMPLNRFPERELHSLWLPPVQLPERVP